MVVRSSDAVPGESQKRYYNAVDAARNKIIYFNNNI